MRSQPANIEVQPLPREHKCPPSPVTTCNFTLPVRPIYHPAATVSTTTIAMMTTSAVTTLAPISPLAGPSPIIIGASVGGLVLLVITGAVVLGVVTAYQRCTHRAKQYVCLVSENTLIKVHLPNMVFKLKRMNYCLSV